MAGLAGDVLLVLELDGPAYGEPLRRAREYASATEERLAADPGNEELRKEEEYSRNRLLEKEQKNSRFFIVVAGLDRALLRARYPDTGRYAIAGGQAHPRVSCQGNTEELRGTISGLSIPSIHVPTPTARCSSP